MRTSRGIPYTKYRQSTRTSITATQNTMLLVPWLRAMRLAGPNRLRSFARKILPNSRTKHSSFTFIEKVVATPRLASASMGLR